MEKQESLELDSLLDLIDENVSENESDQIIKAETSNNGISNKSYVDIDIFSPGPGPSSDDSNTAATPQNSDISLIHMGDTSEDEGSEDKEYLTETGQLIKEKIQPKANYRDNKKEKTTWKKNVNSDCHIKENAHSLDKLTGIKIINPVVPFDVMEKRLQSRRLIKMSFIKSFIQKGDIDGDWVTVGALIKKVPPKSSKNGKLYSIWKLTDLHDTDKLVSLFLFGEVHKEHWKLPVGAVIGLLNPDFMDTRSSDDYLTVKIDHPGKLMLIGTSKDFGHCKGARKDGTKCTMVVNLSQCQFCSYHVKSEYQKFSKRSDIQTSWSGGGISLREKVLKGQNMFYGGQTFVSLGKPEKKSNSIKMKDKLTLSNLPLKRKAESVFKTENSSVKRIAELYGNDVSKIAEKNSEFINNRLISQTPGSQNLIQHMMKNKITKEEKVTYIKPRELLKQNVLHRNYHMKSTQNMNDPVPVLGRGLCPGQNVSFNLLPHNSTAPEQYAKVKAIQKIQQRGPLMKRNPNAIKSNPEPKKIQAVLQNSFEKELADDKVGEEKEVLSFGKLGCIDLNSEKVQKYLNQKSSHAYEIEMAEMEKEAAYFNRLEKKEQMEEKMCATKEIVCDVVSCKLCRYTAHKAADRCKDESHPLKCHKAIKRFFACKDCQRRTECFSRFPHQSCRNCGSSRFERTGMMRVRSGPKLESETLQIFGDDVKFLNSL